MKAQLVESLTLFFLLYLRKQRSVSTVRESFLLQDDQTLWWSRSSPHQIQKHRYVFIPREMGQPALKQFLAVPFFQRKSSCTFLLDSVQLLKIVPWATEEKIGPLFRQPLLLPGSDCLQEARRLFLIRAESLIFCQGNLLQPKQTLPDAAWNKICHSQATEEEKGK